MQWSRAGAAVAKVVPHKGTEMADDADVGGCEQGRLVVGMVAQLSSRTQNMNVVDDVTCTSENHDSARPLDKKNLHVGTCATLSITRSDPT